MRVKAILFGAAMVGVLAGSAWSDIPPAATMSPDEAERIERSVTYSGCNEARAAGKAPLLAGEPGYRAEMDGDGDGRACEPHR